MSTEKGLYKVPKVSFELRKLIIYANLEMGKCEKNTWPKEFPEVQWADFIKVIWSNMITLLFF